ncbi:EAL domain-containing protein [Pseudoalteromonas sp. G4]|uniref:EAL domain-containing protein n=1 Tax=Pseudoalteromonas sp. G4 TaxID=2992761 RepID=UPI00237DB494|nr:GGDEF domain-containing phosphodiesterase [Pseudoalteromonas sp. G4]MDE3273908.1 EAL domain-containing protein [Pseudoalteromonas sp. G4]
MKKIIAASTLVLSSFSLFAATDTVMFTFPSLVAGMLLVSWLLAILQAGNAVIRVLDILLGVATLAFLSTYNVVALIICALILTAECYFTQQKKAQRMALWLNIVSLALFLALSAGFYLEVLNGAWLGVAVVFHYVCANLYTFFRRERRLQVALSNKMKGAEAHNDKQLLLDRSLFLNGYDNWQKNSLSRVLVLIKLEGLGKINRMVGHDFGDLLIAKLGKKINDELNASDVLSLTMFNEPVKLCYLGGVDFAFAVDTSVEAHLHQRLVHRIYDLVHKPTHVENIDSELSLRAAIVEDQKQLKGQQLLAQAFLSIEFTNEIDWLITFEKEIAERAEKRKQLLADLSILDFERDFQLYFHPVIDIETNQILFIELLLRWHHPKFGTLEAKHFIDEINAAGLTLPIAHWVSEKAAELALAIKLEEIHIPISVNLFGKELLQDEFIDHLAEVLVEHRLSEGDIIIEAPANVFMSLPDFGESILRRLKENNIAVCLDDLGIEPLQLSRLPRLALNYVKVDGSIVKELAENVNTRSLLSGIIDMSNSLGIKVVCEGIESETQYTYISTMKCHAAQGYLFSRPLPNVGLLGWLKQWQKRLANGERPY